MLHDVFICHASEDKASFVRALADALRDQNLDVWYDEFSLRVGDSLRETIDRGLAASRYGVVVLSRAFFKKRWANRELNGLVAKQMSDPGAIILPIWHGVDHAEIASHSPPLADIVATRSSDGVDAVVRQLLKVLQPTENPLVLARNELASRGLFAPPTSDDWWLDIVEIKESFVSPDYADRWTFPLLFKDERTPQQRAANLAMTSMQLDWIGDEGSRQISQISHPEDVHGFLGKWPGLKEIAFAHPHMLALYAPQLTIPSYSGEFSAAFDDLLRPDNSDAYCPPFYSESKTLPGTTAACGELAAWRHPTFGNYDPDLLAYMFSSAHDFAYRRSDLEAFECLVWLLSDSSSWMPQMLRETLLLGFKQRDLWYRNSGSSDWLEALQQLGYGKLRRSKKTSLILASAIEIVSRKLHLAGTPQGLASKLVDSGFLEAFNDYQEWLRDVRRPRRKRNT